MERSSTSSEPLLRPSAAGQTRLTPLAAFLGRAAGRRGAPALVRETAARQLEERRVDWGYSRPVVALDVSWNLAFAVAALAVLASTVGERPNVPIRLWLVVYTLQGVVHVALVLTEYRRRSRQQGGVEEGTSLAADSEENGGEEEDERGDVEGRGRNRRFRVVKCCESLNTVLSFLWWIVGFYWVVSGGEGLLQNAPTLYWLAVTFLAFDVFLAIFCVALACLIGVALCCCLPCIIAVLYAVAGQDGASDADINVLRKYKFVQPKVNGEKANAGLGTMISVGNNGGSAHERVLLLEDAECCICLTAYEDGTELHSLPCNHHFHSSCIVKWLRINATCPLCKYNIVKGNE